MDWSFEERSRRFQDMLHRRVDRLVKAGDCMLLTISTQLEAHALTLGCPSFAKRCLSPSTGPRSTARTLPFFRTRSSPIARGFPACFAEAVAYGKPVVVTRGTWMAEEIEAGRAAGAISEDLRPSSISQAVARCVTELEPSQQSAQGHERRTAEEGSFQHSSTSWRRRLRSAEEERPFGVLLAALRCAPR